MKLFSINSFVVVLLSLLGAGCGKNGGTAGSTPAEPEAEPAVVVVPGPEEMFGYVFLNDTSTPASGLTMMLLNHTESLLSMVETDVAGRFSFPLETFKSNVTYSLEVIGGNWGGFGSVDFSIPDTGNQSAFTYAADGYGCDIGQLFLVVDSFGLIDRSSTNLLGQLAGGFRVTSSALDLKDFPLPEVIKSLSIGYNLVPENPSEILSSFYRRIENPESYGTSLNGLSGLNISSVVRTGENLNQLKIVNAGPWLAGSSIIDSSADNPITRIWSWSDFVVPQASKLVAQGIVLPGGPVYSGDVFMLSYRIENFDELIVPTSLGLDFGMIPKVSSIGLNGGAVTEVDYDSDTLSNGLTRPFIWNNSDVVVVVDLPKDLAEKKVSSEVLPTVEISVSFYQEDSSSILSQLSVKAGDIVSPYDNSGSLAATSISTVFWNADQTMVKHSLDVAATRTSDNYSFTLDNALLFSWNSAIKMAVVDIVFTDGISRAGTSVVFIR